MSEIFKFKQFSVHQEKTAMKVGTDGVLLGAWCTIKDEYNSVLDIGSGTGLIALMMAQRSWAETIDAVELDFNAYEQTVDNFENSDWGDRLFCYNASFQEFADEMSDEEEYYDLIISNPPFYNDSFQSKNTSRNMARFTDALSFEDLFLGVAKLLSKKGKFAIIVPYKEENKIQDIALQSGLHTNRICRVKGNVNTEIKRSLIEFSFDSSGVCYEDLVIEKSRHQYTEAYLNLTKAFYLKM